MLARRHLLDIFTGRGMTRVVVVIAVRLCDCVMHIGLVVLELICVVIPER
jgi:hypothetical protein